MTAVAESISNGNMTGWGNTTYTWDEFNQLVAINGTSLDASYKYDAIGRRIEKTINGTTTRYLYDGADIVLEMDESNVATAYYIRTLNMDEPLARVELDSGGNVTGIRFYLADALGSTIALTDENGDIKTRYNYTPFGEPQVIDEASDNPFMFTGREYDEGTGLYYYRARYYSWELGRFISEDPIGLAGGINMYAYVGNSPLNWLDPWGLEEEGKRISIEFCKYAAESGNTLDNAHELCNECASAFANCDKDDYVTWQPELFEGCLDQWCKDEGYVGKGFASPDCKGKPNPKLKYARPPKTKPPRTKKDFIKIDKGRVERVCAKCHRIDYGTGKAK